MTYSGVFQEEAKLKEESQQNEQDGVLKVTKENCQSEVMAATAVKCTLCIYLTAIT